MSLGEAGYAQTASGIIIPAQTLDRLERRMDPQEFKQLLRALALAGKHGMRGLFSCDTCHAPIAVEQHDQIVTQIPDGAGKTTSAGGGRPSLRCGCTTWAVK